MLWVYCQREQASKFKKAGLFRISSQLANRSANFTFNLHLSFIKCSGDHKNSHDSSNQHKQNPVHVRESNENPQCFINCFRIVSGIDAYPELFPELFSALLTRSFRKQVETIRKQFGNKFGDGFLNVPETVWKQLLG